MDQTLFDLIVQAPILPTTFPASAEVLCAYADALAAEGYPALEVLARPPEATWPALREVFGRPQRRRVRWGIGTCTSRAIALQAVALRPDFIVSPAFSRRVLEVAADAGIPYIPAVHGFQDVQNVLDAFDERGLAVKLLKLCPVYDVTDEYLGALRGCFPGIQFCPTGEVLLENYQQWKQRPGIVAPMGSRLVPREAIAGGDAEAIRARLRLLRQLAKEAEQARAGAT